MKAEQEPKLLWQGKFVRVLKRGRWEYADRVCGTGAVVIVAVTPESKLVLIEQYRLPVDGRVLELPAGIAGDVPGEEHEDLTIAARRELFEETGYEAGEMLRLFAGPSSAGLASEIVTFFKASGLNRTGRGGGAGHEEIVVHEVGLGEIDEWLKRREIEGLLVDPKVYAGLYAAGHQNR